MPTVLNRAGYDHALSLIRGGKIDESAGWSISADEENELLGDNDWEKYKNWFLGHDTGEDPQTKAAWKYPFGKSGKAYRSALMAIRQRAGQQNATDIFNAAGRLISAISGSEHSSWIPILATGTWTDSEGVTRNWTEEILNEIVQSYDPKFHEAPAVIGHPKLNAPAYGWVEALKREGKIVFAKLKDVVPEFVEMVNKGLFKKRSASLRKDIKEGVWYLNHIGFLGAVPPAVKGLPDISLSQGGEVEIEILEEDMAKEKDPKELEAEFTAKLKDEEDKRKKAEEERKRAFEEKAQIERKLAKAEIEKRIDELGTKEKGKVTPAMKDAGIVEFCMRLDQATEVEFSSEKKKSPREWFFEFLELLPNLVEYAEFAKKTEAVEKKVEEEQIKEGKDIADRVK